MFEILIKTFLRPECLRRCVDSIRKYYPNVFIRVCDDGNGQFIDNDSKLRYYRLPFYSGLSVGKNFLVQQVQTPYFVTCDDDFVFTEDTDLNKMLRVMETTNEPTLVSGTIREEEGVIRKGAGHLEVEYSEKNGRKIIRYYYGSKASKVLISGIECIPCRIMPQLLMGEKSVFDYYNIHWRDEMKRSDHLPFYLDLSPAVKCYCIPSVIVNHLREQNPEYKRYKDNDIYWRMVCERKIEFKTIYDSKQEKL